VREQPEAEAEAEAEAKAKAENRGTYPLLGRRGRKEEARLPTLLTVEHHGRRARPFVAPTPNQSSCELIQLHADLHSTSSPRPQQAARLLTPLAALLATCSRTHTCPTDRRASASGISSVLLSHARAKLAASTKNLRSARVMPALNRADDGAVARSSLTTRRISAE